LRKTVRSAALDVFTAGYRLARLAAGWNAAKLAD
jgi:hypothetical protein